MENRLRESLDAHIQGDHEGYEGFLPPAIEDMQTIAEEPFEDRLRRAYLNGFRDGAERAGRGQWDHS